MADNQKAPEFSGRDTRQGEIILRTRWRRIVFIAGLIGIGAIALLLSCSA